MKRQTKDKERQRKLSGFLGYFKQPLCTLLWDLLAKKKTSQYFLMEDVYRKSTVDLK